MIRLATETDIPSILPLLVRFNNSIELGRLAGCVKADLEALSLGLIHAPTSDIIVLEVEQEIVGVIGVLLTPHMANHSYLTCTEVFWWVEEAHRGLGSTLLKEAELWAIDHKANQFHVATIESELSDRLETYYKRKGFKAIERLFMKELN